VGAADFTVTGSSDYDLIGSNPGDCAEYESVDPNISVLFSAMRPCQFKITFGDDRSMTIEFFDQWNLVHTAGSTWATDVLGKEHYLPVIVYWKSSAPRRVPSSYYGIKVTILNAVCESNWIYSDAFAFTNLYYSVEEAKLTNEVYVNRWITNDIDAACDDTVDWTNIIVTSSNGDTAQAETFLSKVLDTSQISQYKLLFKEVTLSTSAEESLTKDGGRYNI